MEITHPEAWSHNSVSILEKKIGGKKKKRSSDVNVQHCCKTLEFPWQHKETHREEGSPKVSTCSTGWLPDTPTYGCQTDKFLQDQTSVPTRRHWHDWRCLCFRMDTLQLVNLCDIYQLALNHSPSRSPPSLPDSEFAFWSVCLKTPKAQRRLESFSNSLGEQKRFLMMMVVVRHGKGTERVSWGRLKENLMVCRCWCVDSWCFRGRPVRI